MLFPQNQARVLLIFHLLISGNEIKALQDLQNNLENSKYSNFKALNLSHSTTLSLYASSSAVYSLVAKIQPNNAAPSKQEPRIPPNKSPSR